ASGIGMRRATGRPRSVSSISSPALTRWITALACCLSSRMPTRSMGTHGSTMMCLQELQRLLELPRRQPIAERVVEEPQGRGVAMPLRTRAQLRPGGVDLGSSGGDRSDVVDDVVEVAVRAQLRTDDLVRLGTVRGDHD